MIAINTLLHCPWIQSTWDASSQDRFATSQGSPWLLLTCGDKIDKNGILYPDNKIIISIYTQINRSHISLQTINFEILVCSVCSLQLNSLCLSGLDHPKPLLAPASLTTHSAYLCICSCSQREISSVTLVPAALNAAASENQAA